MSFWKGFFSVFNLFPSSKSYDEIKEEVDSKIQNLHDKVGWKPNNSWSVASEVTQKYEKDQTAVYSTSDEFLQEMIKLVPSGCFQPYAHYNADMDALQVYFKDTDSYTQPLNQNVEIHLSHDTDEITGATILNIRKLIGENK